jgi:hypothetical protein
LEVVPAMEFQMEEEQFLQSVEVQILVLAQRLGEPCKEEIHLGIQLTIFH